MSGPRPTLSVVVTACNQLIPLKLTLSALLAHAPAVSCEFLVVDCGSTDGTDRFLAALAGSGRIRCIRAGSLGRTAARNLGAARSVGEHILFLDPGLIPAADWWRAPLGTLTKDPTVGAVAGKIVLSDGRIDHAGLALLEWREPEAEGRRPMRLAGRSILAGKKADAPGADRALRVQCLAGEALLVRSEAFADVGGYAAEIGGVHDRGKADYDGDPAGMHLSLRLREEGWQCVYRPESVWTRVRSATGATESCAKDADAFSRIWLGRIRPDFVVGDALGVRPEDHEAIRPYVEPVMACGRDRDESAVEASVVLLAHHELGHTRLCLESVLEHTDPAVELILVDNGSGNGCPEYLARTAAERGRTLLIRNRENLGFATGNNQGLAAASGRHVVLLSSDTVVTAGWLERLTAAAGRNPRVGLVGPVTNHTTGLQRLSDVAYDPDSLGGLTGFAAEQASRHAGRHDHTLRLAGFCLLVKRELLVRIGGLDEAFGRGSFEDNDYCLRAGVAGYEAVIARDCFVHHFGAEGFRTPGVDYGRQVLDKWRIFKRKWGLPRDLAFDAPFDLSTMLGRRFDPAVHFQRLPDPTAGGIWRRARTAV